jgi:hypothetical protein
MRTPWRDHATIALAGFTLDLGHGTLVNSHGGDINGFHGGEIDAMSRVTHRPDSEPATGRSTNGNLAARGLRQLSLAIALYGLIGWIYVAICSLAAPRTLPLPLTHLVPWLREDTSGVISFILSFLAFMYYRTTWPD